MASYLAGRRMANGCGRLRAARRERGIPVGSLVLATPIPEGLPEGFQPGKHRNAPRHVQRRPRERGLGNRLRPRCCRAA